MLYFMFALGALLELATVTVPALWRLRKLAVVVLASLIGIWTGLIIFEGLGLLSFSLLIVSVYRIFNLLRIGKSLTDEQKPVIKTRRTSIFLLLIQTICYEISLLGLNVDWIEMLTILSLVQLLVALMILRIVARNLLKTSYYSNTHFYSDKDLPTVTVAIPARNETADLASCLESILTSNYPKLEILVLDDCSQDKTSDIIRSYAQEGVRFLEGKPPKERWLAKNQAYEQLAAAASGQLILFCGVDIRMGPESIRALVSTLLNKKRDMLSVMPLRVGGGVSTAFIQPMRYWWELALPRRFFNRPPVLSSCWLIRRKTLKKLGGFAAVSRTIIPEGFFARELIKSDKYSFIRASAELEIKTVKSVEGQLETAVRTRYPQLRNRPENVLTLTVAQAVLLFCPFILAVTSIWQSQDIITWLAVISCGLLVFNHYLIMSASNPANSVIALVNFPFAIVTEIIITHISMYRYEFGVMEWKGRNICIPVMSTEFRWLKSESRKKV